MSDIEKIPVPTRDRDELLRDVVQRGNAIKRRRTFGLVGLGAASTALLLVVALVLTLPSPSPDPLGEISPLASRTDDPSDEDAPSSRHEKERAARSEAEPRSAAAEGCRNSYDPVCGEFSWDPKPAPNSEITFEIRQEPEAPKAGETVTFYVTARDDAGVEPESMRPVAGESASDSKEGWDSVKARPDCQQPEERYGKWTPPDPVFVQVSHVFQETYRLPGEYEVSFPYVTAMCDPYNPYRSFGTLEHTVTVTLG